MGGTRILLENLRADKTETTPDALLTSGVGVFGAWVELIPLTTIICNWANVTLHDNNSTDPYEIDIAMGPVGQEVPIVEGLLFHVDLVGQSIITLTSTLKTEIAKGVRLSARTKSVLVTDTIKIKLVLQGT